MKYGVMERRMDERRGPVRRNDDIKRAMLEESLKELPRYFVSYVDAKYGVYSFYYNDLVDAQEMISALKEQGLTEDDIGFYARQIDE